MSATERKAQARAEAQALVEQLQISNKERERGGGVILPDKEYGKLERVLTRRLIKRAA